MATHAAFQPLTAQSIQRALSTRTFGRTLSVLDEASSTNQAAAALAHENGPHGAVVVAECQTAGRGRLGRHWHSPSGNNLYFSVLLRTLPSREQQPLWLSWIPLIAALAVRRAVQVVAGLTPSVKWPNDVLVGHRKLGGILCESSGVGTAHAAVVVGVGVNVNIREDELPDELRPIATSLAMEAGQPFDRAALLATLLLELETRCESFLAGRRHDILDEYMLRCSTIGRRVRVELAHGEQVEGTAASIQPDGSLRIVREDGTSTDVRTGDVVHLW